MLSIMLLTVALTLATAPLTFLAMRSQRRLAALQPEVERLRRSFGNDGQRLAQETTALFKAKRVSPFGGCLPMLIQAPVFLAMFRHVQNVAADGLRFGPVDLAQTGVAALHAGPASALLLGRTIGGDDRRQSDPDVVDAHAGAGRARARATRSACTTPPRVWFASACTSADFSSALLDLAASERRAPA